MDTLSAVMDGHRARGASLLRCEMRAPWGLRIEDEAALGLVVMVAGTAQLLPRHGAAIALGAGDLALVKGTRPWVFADDVATEPSIVIEPGNVCRSLTGQHLAVSLGLGTRTWGNAGDEPGDTTFLTASWELASQVTGRLLDALPDVAVVRAGEADPTLSGLLAREVQRTLPGQDVVLDRLVDLVLIEAVRQWFARTEGSAPSWWRAGSDPVVGRALAALHDEPGHPWTLDALAAHVHVSRATLSRRFTELVGQSPMAYLTHWRLARAADLLRSGSLSVEHVAHAVGYANAFAFSAAFKREHGSAPRAFRSAPVVPGASSPVPG
ncbi:AraC family transcriptional regulator [Terracoccus sp. 273MFTsu3.1]|uniref:AraC family transcriptional regulator n=1 Tax=Terracoccus sp. 273MFTsu3.1 TaxID=1172188 RepID=UPI0003739184|nr:AraC family transcriptional regulator [Terracoccus sp. 273MFTsu3.1]